MAIVIELLSRSNKVLGRFRFEKESVTLGRGYGCDVILEDPHVSPEHARISLSEDGCWTVSDLSSENGVYLKNSTRIFDHSPIKSGDIVILGLVRIRFLQSDHEVSPTVILTWAEKTFTKLGKPIYALVVLSAFLAVLGLSFYFSYYQEIAFKSFYNDILPYLAWGIVWAGCWSLMGRIFRHEARFLSHLSIYFLFIMVLIVIELTKEIVAYNTLSISQSYNYELVVSAIASIALIWCCLYLATHLRRVNRMVVTFTIVFGLFATIMATTIFTEAEFSRSPDYVSTVLPDQFRVSNSITLDKFLADTDIVFSKLSETVEMDK